ncbi:DUF726 domain-containing protein [Halovenus sp. WSH3]|uniref:DUF726 domain-containing protein n=1 Tax=Halovenus carboxidivorans TaxID=2692199 RepID=A0A6B0T781_9EURY|nr:DUF726 domain-containing protein [Halovenus carboxidivorans]MXR52066.1 DUF726 domain-containing protein [Halovenus carboxidivorans]
MTDRGSDRRPRSSARARLREWWARVRERAAGTGARLQSRFLPALEAQLTDWPTELDRRIDLTAEPAVETDDVPGEGELVVYVHGFLGQGRLDIARMSGAHQAAALQEALRLEFESRDREPPVVAAAMWDSSTTWTRAKGRSVRAGEQLADWLDGQTQPIHLVGHSLGSRVALEALRNDPGDCLESVALLGAAVDPDSVCHRYRPAIESVDGPVYSYHSENDTLVCRLYRVGELSAGLGCRGSDCRGGLLRSSGRLPSNYTDVDVTDQVLRHLDYYKPAEHTAGGNCVGELVDNQLLG